MNKTVRIIIGLLGLSFVIIIHELGHFLACKLFDIATPIFSIGFGPKIFGIKIGTTLFQIALVPLGGYVAIDEAQLIASPYWIKVIIILAGIATNIAFAYFIFWVFKMRNLDVKEMIEESTAHTSRGFMGPIGIINLISYSVGLSFNHFLLILGGLSMSIGLFNLLPIPFLDGGQLAQYTIEALSGPISDRASNIASMIFLLIFLLFMLLISAGDIRNIWRKKSN